MSDEPVDPNLTIFQRVGAIVAEMPAIGKNQRNEQQKFMYRGHDDVMNALNPLLSKYGVFFTPQVKKRITDQRATRSGGVMYEVNLLVEYMFYGPAGDSFKASAWGEGTDSGDKSTNKAMTMALKNVLAQTFAVTTEEHSLLDTDRNSDEPSTGRASAQRQAPAPAAPPTQAAGPPAAASAKRATAAQKKLLANLIAELGGIDPGQNWTERVDGFVLKQWDGRGLGELTAGEYDYLLQRIEKIRDDLVANGNAPGAMPPPTDEERDQALLEAGIDPADAAPASEIPFGEPAEAMSSSGGTDA